MTTREIQPWLYALAFDLRHSLRSLFHNRTLSLAMLFVLTLGIAVNTTIFSVMQQVLLRPLPYFKPGQLVMAWESNPALGKMAGARLPTSWTNLDQWRQRNRTFTGLEAFDLPGYNLTGHDRPVRVLSARATSGFFDLLGVNAQFGRVLSPADSTNDHVAVLSYSFFKNHFHSPAGTLGQTIFLDSDPYVIVGVLPRSFHLPAMYEAAIEYKPDLWLPLPQPKSDAERNGNRLYTFGRLREGVTVQQAKDDLSGIARQREDEDPKRERGWRASVFPLPVEDQYPAVRTALYVLSASGLLILLLACANLANLMLARNLAKRREIAIHLALGGTRTRLAGRALAESLMVALAAAILGFLLAGLGVKVISVMDTGQIHSPERIHLDLVSSLFALALCVLTAVLFGPLPAWLSTRTDLAQSLKENSRGTVFRLRSVFRRILLVTQVAFSVFLAVIAVLTIRSFQKALALDPGFRAAHVLTGHIVLPKLQYADKERRIALCRRLLSDIQALPGVKSASLIDYMPLYAIRFTYLTIAGRPTPARQLPPVVDYAHVGPRFFETLGIHADRGRLFAPEDFRDNANVVIINEAVAKRDWPGQNPIGAHIIRRGGDSSPLEIIGVVNDFVQYSADTPPRPEMFLPAQEMQEMTVVIRAAGDPLRLAPALESTVLNIDKDLPVSKVEALHGKLTTSIGQRHFDMILLSVFAALGLVVALVGIYGLLTFNISARTHDFAIRRALGAPRPHILKLLARQVALPLAAGVLLGMLLSRLSVRLLSNLFFREKITDPVALLGLPVLVLAASFLLLVRPAWKASAIEPGECLRHE